MKKNLLFSAIAPLLLLLLTGSSPELPADRQVTLTSLTNLCPTTLVQGDREFGRAPTINIRAKLEISSGGNSLVAVIDFSALERNSNPGTLSTMVREQFRRTVYSVDAGYKITAIKPATISSAVVDRVGLDAGGEFGDCKPGMIAQASPGGLIKRVVWYGDTGGNDVASSASNCNCDTRIESIEFNKVTVTIERR